MRELKIPTHIGIIMDGNGRWASSRGLPRNMGHKEGIAALERTVDAALKYGVKILSVFAFSTENWKRSKSEIDGIFNLVRQYLKSDTQKFVKKGVKVVSMGDLSPFPQDLQRELEYVKNATAKNSNLTLNIALNYGGKADIVRSVNNLIAGGKKTVTEQDISSCLYSANLPDPDLVLRTSGEMRISNFMVYQMAYSELYFPKVMWPDFSERHLYKAIKEYSKRNRRYGGVK